MTFSFIIPVYNRPEEIEELLESIVQQTYKKDFEVVVVEDGSTITCEHVVAKYKDVIPVVYFYKENSGPGDSRNYGMKVAVGNYFIILDSDCILPPQYLEEVEQQINLYYVDCFGGPDAALQSFSVIQKSINYVMTSPLTTGGIRGGSEKLGKFQPRSFNMGLSKKAFQATGGYGKIHPGEDPDLSIRLWKLSFETMLFPTAFVYHKRRIDWGKFYHQVHKFGKARPILNKRYPEYAKRTFWLPSLFLVGLVLALLGLLMRIYLPIILYALYTFLVFFHAWKINKNIKIAFNAIIAMYIQFYGYGWGFLKSSFKLNILNIKAEKAMPEMFFK